MELNKNDCLNQLFDGPPLFTLPIEHDFVSETQASGCDAFEEIDSPQTQSSQATKANKPKKKLKNFTKAEDLIVIKAWIHTSVDNVVAADQTSEKYWERITKLYNEHRGAFDERPSVKSRWTTINTSVGKFKAYFGKAKDQAGSGSVPDDWNDNAHLMYLKLEKASFGLDHCWKVLRDVPKWMELTDIQAKKPKGGLPNKNNSQLKSNLGTSEVVDVDLSDNSQPTTLDEAKRPMGRKRAKSEQKFEKIQAGEARSYGNHLNELREDKKNLEKKHEKRRDLKEKKKKQAHERKIALQHESLLLEKKKQEMQEEVVLLEKKKQASEEDRRKRKDDEKRMEANLKLMTMDISHLDEGGRQYIESRRRVILSEQLSSESKRQSENRNEATL